MPDFNKGDFTQQGVAGHVNANLRLNEKRLVNIDLTSNEEAEGCTISGTVTDLLNDKVYAIGSSVSGNIEITENGENINVAPYATATVNVSGGVNLKTIALTMQNEPVLYGIVTIDNDIIKYDYDSTMGSTIDALVTYSDLGNGSVYNLTFSADGTITAENAVNCTFDDQTIPDAYAIIITDISSDASITLKASK